MKKALAILLVVVMTFALAVPVFADEYVKSKEAPGEDDKKIVIPVDDDDEKEEIKKEIEDIIKDNEDIKEAIEDYFDDVVVDDIVVEDIKVIVIDEDVEKDEDGKTSVVIDIGYSDDDDTPMFIFKGEDGEWVIIDPNDIIRNADNTFTIRVSGSGILATMSVKAHINKGGVTSKGDSTSPQTGAQSSVMAIVAVSVICLAGVVVMFSAKRKSENN